MLEQVFFVQSSQL